MCEYLMLFFMIPLLIKLTSLCVTFLGLKHCSLLFNKEVLNNGH